MERDYSILYRKVPSLKMPTVYSDKELTLHVINLSKILYQGSFLHPAYSAFILLRLEECFGEMQGNSLERELANELDDILEGLVEMGYEDPLTD